jgi:hypothetical protein
MKITNGSIGQIERAKEISEIFKPYGLELSIADFRSDKNEYFTLVAKDGNKIRLEVIDSRVDGAYLKVVKIS